ncbi:membrane protein FxsA [Nitratireductor mangrovi]|uniref:Membrane protein FxsA n=1 Tax=Nitratireductor mangrovi TaxID=2599600 RepID=A0A5B8L2C1_9HYPH|nr:FxsA family protein [Nitratireductor mangrovi]QDZ01850.1 membrane protein FxsA [Nitratireductor mangrovi]
MRFPLIFAIFLIVPMLEIAAFVVIGGRIGVAATLAIVVLTALVGSILLRVQGFGLLRRIQEETDQGRVPKREVVHGAMILFAGLLLLLPGFVTDAVGFTLFIPAIRDAIWGFVSSRLKVRFNVGIDPDDLRRPRPPGDGKTIDLDPDDFSSAGSAESPWRDDPKQRH